MSEPSHFISMLRLGRPTFHDDMTEAEGDILSEHSDYLQELFAADKILFAGTSSEAPFGLVVLQGMSRAEATALMDADPAVAAGILASELTDFSVYLVRGETDS